MNKLPPQKVELEQTVLASILIDSDSIDDVQLQSTDFYKPAHQVIFKAMSGMQLKNIDIDLVSVGEYLRENGELEKAGGLTYLSRLIDFPVSVNIEHHCNKIKEAARLRNLIEISTNTISSCYDATLDPIYIIEDAQRNISGLNSDAGGISDIKDIVNATIDELGELRLKDGSLSGVPTGFRSLDAHTSGLQDADFILIGARPSMGKTAIAMNIVKHAVYMLEPTLVFSLEMPKEHLTHRILSEMASVDGMKFKSGKITKSEWEDINRAASKLYDYPLHIIDDSGLTINKILSISRSFKRKYNIKLIMIDYIQLISGWNKDGQGSKAEISRSIKLLAKSLNIPVIALSQLSRALEKRDNKRPVMSDLREAGALEQDADIIAFLYRHEVYETQEEKNTGLNLNKAELLIRKNRQGSIGKIDLHFTPEFTKFSNVEVY